jgi:AraC-like DNA-binding protein
VKYFVDFSGTRCKEVLSANRLTPGAVVQTSAPDELMRLFDDLISTGQRGGPRCGPLCVLLLEQIVFRTFETLIPVHSWGSKAFTTFTTCYRYIVEHHVEISDIRQVAEACSVDVSYMCRLFQRYSRQSAYTLLMRERMAVAAKLLAEEGVLVKQAAEQFGFSDPFHFSRAFRRIYGISPIKYQRLFKNRK